MPPGLRYDLQIISDLIKPESKVLDLGCGDGTLLNFLKKEKKINPYGVEISEKELERCIGKGLPVYHGDIDEGLIDYKKNSFDYVILSQTLQVTKKPYKVLKEMLRIGKRCIVSFPNFGYGAIRFYLLFKGKMPRVEYLPYNWYDSPNIHHLTIKDFYDFCEQNNISIIEKIFLSFSKKKYSYIKIWPNLFAQYGIFLITKELL